MSGSAVRAATELGSVKPAEGELRFAVSIAGNEHELWFRSSVPIAAGAEAAAVATLLPALAVGEPLRIEAPIAPAVLDGMEEAQAILCAWARAGAWPEALPFSHPIDLVAEPAQTAHSRGGRGVAAFFSGGVDSLATVLRHPEITHLVHVEGFDVPLEQVDVAATVRDRITIAAGELGKELVLIETNVRELSDPYLPWVTYYGAALGTIALLLSDQMSRVLIATGLTHRGCTRTARIRCSITSGEQTGSRSSTTAPRCRGSRRSARWPRARRPVERFASAGRTPPAPTTADAARSACGRW